MRQVVHVLLLLSAEVPLSADDWPQWRGPNRDGVWSETGVLEAFPSGGLKVRWRAPVGVGFSSPVVALLYNDRGELIRARLTREGYQELSRAALIQPTYAFGGRNRAWTPPAFANHHVFVRTDRELVCASLAAQP